MINRGKKAWEKAAKMRQKEYLKDKNKGKFQIESRLIRNKNFNKEANINTNLPNEIRFDETKRKVNLTRWHEF